MRPPAGLACSLLKGLLAQGPSPEWFVDVAPFFEFATAFPCFSSLDFGLPL